MGTLQKKTPVDFVDYGVQEQRRDGGPPSWAGLRIRLYAPSELVSGNFVHSHEFLKLALNPGGDSGVPDLLRDTNIVLGVNLYVTNVNCGAVGYSARVNTPEVLDWINSFP